MESLIEIEGKKTFSLPEGGTIIKKSCTVSAREIQNGFILRKSWDIKWKPANEGDTQYEYFTEEWYTKENPVKITMPKGEKSLADKL